MSLSLVIVIFVSIALLFAQFGRRMSASNAVSWWLASAFLIVATVSPSAYRPVADFFGIETISNFVLAALSFFIFCNMIELTASHTKVERKLRKFVSMAAAEEFTKNRKGFVKAKALVVLPCYNEESVLSEIVGRVKEMCKQNPHVAYCFVNDGSSDSSEQILVETAEGNFVTHRVNVGVAGVLLTGFTIAKKLDINFVVQCDSDGQHPIENIPAMVADAVRTDADLLIGSRFTGAGPADLGSTTSLRYFGSRAISGMLRFFCRGIGDPTSGFRVYSEQARNILLKDMPDEYPEPESIALLALAGANLREIRVPMTSRKGGVSSIGGIKSSQYMLKVFSALLGLRMRSLFRV